MRRRLPAKNEVRAASCMALARTQVSRHFLNANFAPLRKQRGISEIRGRSGPTGFPPEQNRLSTLVRTFRSARFPGPGCGLGCFAREYPGQEAPMEGVTVVDHPMVQHKL